MSTEPGAGRGARSPARSPAQLPVRPPTWPGTHELISLGTVGSTLDEARARAGTFRGPAWITARAQTRARGRRGRAWASPPGNLATTLVLPDPGPPERAAQRSFIAALAVRDAACALGAPGADLALKWPNDVLLSGGKLAGILLEGLEGGALAIGIGVNLTHVPPLEALEPGALAPARLADALPGAEPASPERFLAHLAPAFARHEATFETLGFGPIRTAWLAHAAGLGAPVTARLPNEEIRGIFETMDEGGRIVLSTAHGPRAIAAGDIFF